MGVGVMLVAVFAVDEAIPWIVDAFGVPRRRAEPMLIPLTVSTGVVGITMVLAGMWLLFSHSQAEATFGPYQQALTRLAAEHGQAPAVNPAGQLVFRGQNDGVPFHFVLDPRSGMVVVRVEQAGRLTLAVMRPEYAPEAGAGLRVGHGSGWELRAELPSLARRLLEDAGLVGVLDRFFAHEHAVGAVHDARGLEVTLGLPEPASVERAGRAGILMATALAQVNGPAGYRG